MARTTKSGARRPTVCGARSASEPEDGQTSHAGGVEQLDDGGRRAPASRTRPAGRVPRRTSMARACPGSGCRRDRAESSGPSRSRALEVELTQRRPRRGTASSSSEHRLQGAASRSTAGSGSTPAAAASARTCAEVTGAVEQAQDQPAVSSNPSMTLGAGAVEAELQGAVAAPHRDQRRLQHGSHGLPPRDQRVRQTAWQHRAGSWVRRPHAAPACPQRRSESGDDSGAAP